MSFLLGTCKTFLIPSSGLEGNTQWDTRSEQKTLGQALHFLSFIFILWMVTNHYTFLYKNYNWIKVDLVKKNYEIDSSDHSDRWQKICNLRRGRSGCGSWEKKIMTSCIITNRTTTFQLTQLILNTRLWLEYIFPFHKLIIYALLGIKLKKYFILHPKIQFYFNFS